MKTANLNLKKSALAVTFAIMTFAVPQQSHASLQREMDSFFGDMSNVTNAGYFETQRRGVLAGGRVTQKSKIFDENLISFVPPSYKAGCGGVDMFGGSFSFISGDQIVQLLRSVAANAKGYAFQIALETIAPNIAKLMDQFQKKIQALNQHLGNSCQLAQGIVNDSRAALTGKENMGASITGMMTGLADDMFSSVEQIDGKSPQEKLKTSAPEKYKELVGNIVWEELKKQNAKSWFTYGNNEMMDIIMSLSGTVIIQDLEKDPNAGNPSDPATPTTNPVRTIPGKPDIIQTLLEGGTATIYTCSSDRDQCMAPFAGGGSPTKTITIEGMGNKVEKMLLGGGSNLGVISKFANNTGRLTAEEEAFMGSLPSGVGSIVRNLAVVSEDASRMFAERASYAVALYMVYTIANDLQRAAELATSQSKNSYANEAINNMRESRRQMNDIYHTLRSKHGDLPELTDYYSSLLNMTRKRNYANQTISVPGKS